MFIYFVRITSYQPPYLLGLLGKRLGWADNIVMETFSSDRLVVLSLIVGLGRK